MKELKRLEKKHERLPRRDMKDLDSLDRLFLWYYDMKHEIILTPWEEKYKYALEVAYKVVLKFYPRYSFERIANYLSKKLSDDPNFDGEIGQRQCLTYVQQSISLHSNPVDVDKEFRRQLYVNRLHDIAAGAEKDKNFSAAVKAIEKAAELENFHQDADERVREMLKNMEAKEIVFAASPDELTRIVEERRKRRIEEIPEAEIDDTE